MSFSASTRDVMTELGVLDAKTLHRRREESNDPTIHPSGRIFKLGIHYRFKSPNSKQIVWDKSAVIRAWTEATRVNKAIKWYDKQTFFQLARAHLPEALESIKRA